MEHQEPKTPNKKPRKNQLDRERELARLYYFQGDSQKAIAERLGVSAQTVNRWVSVGDWEVTVDAGSSNVVSVVQSGAGRIVKKGAGKMLVTGVYAMNVPDRPTRLMVVNLDYCKDRTLAVTAPNALERFSVSDGKWLPLAEAGVRFDLALKGGEGVLLRLKD